MDQETQQELIEAMSRDWIAKTAPQELPLFRAHLEAYFQNPNYGTQKSKEEMLGFGTSEAIMALTPVVLPIAAEILTYLADQFKDSVKAETGPLLSSLVRRVFKKFGGDVPEAEEGEAAAEPGAGAGTAPGEASPAEAGSPDPPVALSQAQIRQIRAIVSEKAELFRLGADQSALLADAVIGSLVLAQD